MKSRTTAIWFVVALLLAGFIWFYRGYWQRPPAGPVALLTGFHPGAITAIQISPAGQHEISAIRTNNAWVLAKPLSYPAQITPVTSLLDALEKLTPAMTISAAEMSQHKNADAEFGFDDPQYTVDVSAGDQDWHLRIGNKTAPGDGVYVRVLGLNGAFITDTDWLKFLPHDANAWRDTALVDAVAMGNVDWIVITNGTKAIELRRDATNHLWRMTYPLQARADSSRIVTALQQLQSATVSRFVTDDPAADLTGYGLQPAELDVWLGAGTNMNTAIHAGRELPEDTNQVYLRREGWSSVLATASEPLNPWRGKVNDFRDRYLFNINAPIAEIEVEGPDGYQLRQNGTNGWMVVGEKFPVDLDKLKEFVHALADLRVSDFVKDAVTGTDLQDYGFVTNNERITLSSVAGDSNSIISRLDFGASDTNRIFVKRGDENYIYGLSQEDFNRLPAKGLEFRDRRIWNFSVSNVLEVTVHQGGRTRQLLRGGANDWMIAQGSQGMINPLAVEETVMEIGQLTASGWLDCNFKDPKDYGLSTNSPQVSVELKDGQKFTVDFGAALPSQTAIAAVTLDGDRWAFVFPPVVFQMIVAYLAIPAQ
jgi:hypothetical protein